MESDVHHMQRLSVVIPTLNEERVLGACLTRLADDPRVAEIVVADGGSTDQTREIAARFPGVRVVVSGQGRGRQMNSGARTATGELLWFLHADCLPPHGAGAAIGRCLADRRVAVGAFRFAFDATGWRYRIVEAGVRLRCLLRRLPYGDQGLFLRRDTFEALGGYREEPLFEDLCLVRAARAAGRIVCLPHPLPTSARRCMRDGVVRTTVRNQLLRLGERLGVRPESLQRLRSPAAGSETAEPNLPQPAAARGASHP